MTQTTIFDAIASRQAKELGMSRAAGKRSAEVEVARSIAIEIAKEKGTVSMDDVMARLIELGHPSDYLQNSAGSVFKCKEFEWTGQFVNSSRVKSHANLLRTWRLKAA